jgi:2-polyprenyl-3-methyl-5-hydroxy-6-metoxy-1,4-benzoquinol methylase
MITDRTELKKTWRDALILNGFNNLEESMKEETRKYLMLDSTEEVSYLFRNGRELFAQEWDEKIKNNNICNEELTKFYNESQYELFDLMNWHATLEDPLPLQYVFALNFAKERRLNNILDFGSGIGSGGILFTKEAFEVTLADISTPLLDFCKYRFRIRGLKANFIDLKENTPLKNHYDIVTVFDVLEHSDKPLEVIKQVYALLKVGGFLVYNADFWDRHKHGKANEIPMHIARPQKGFRLNMAKIGFKFYKTERKLVQKHLYIAKKTETGKLIILSNIAGLVLEKFTKDVK